MGAAGAGPPPRASPERLRRRGKKTKFSTASHAYPQPGATLSTCWGMEAGWWHHKLILTPLTSDTAVAQRSPTRDQERHGVGQGYLPGERGREDADDDVGALVDGHEDGAHDERGQR